MSFGFSLGDFITVIELANKIRKDFVDAPDQFKAISNEVRSLSITLQDIDINLSNRELNDQQKTHLQEISTSCRNFLNELEKTAGKYQSLECRGGSLSTKAKRVWKRFNWEPEDIHELRDRITSNILLLNTFLGGISSQTIIEAKRGIDQLNRKQNDQERRTILDWLTTIDYASQQSDFINRRQAGTGQWLLDSEEYQTWVQTPKKTLFCPGIPGAGKTILTAITIDDLTIRFQNEEKIGIAYVYCNFRQQDEQTADHLLASLLKQLSQDMTALPDSVKALYEKYKDQRTRPSFDEISRAFQSVAIMFSKVFIIIDALDECQMTNGCRTRFLKEIFIAQTKSKANIFATSRFMPEVMENFEESISLEIRASKEDVQRYLEGQMFRLPGFVVRSLELQEEIKLSIIEAVDGMFLLAQLHLESLIGKRAPKAARNALQNLAKGSGAYDHAYEDAMERINGQIKDQKELAKQALYWITCAKRPLTTSELQHALAVEIGESQLDEDNIPQVEDIASVCAGLVTVDKESSIIRLVHYTTQEYFNRTWQKWFPNAQSIIATVCVAYLSFHKFESGTWEDDEELEERLKSNQFYGYASKNWGHHAREASVIIPEVISFLKGKSQLEASFHAARLGYFLEQMTGLHSAAYFGIEPAVKLLLEKGVDVAAADIYGLTPLHGASAGGHVEAIKLLLKKGANIAAADNYRSTPLHWASIEGHVEATKLLLEKGADIAAADTYGSTPLHEASRYGHIEAIKLLLKKGADIAAADTCGSTPLHWASVNGHVEATKLLLEKGADIAADNNYGSTPLHLASRNGQVETIKLLLEKEADVNSKDSDGQTPLLIAAEIGHKDTLRLLLDNSADVSIENRSGWSAVQVAAHNRHEEVEHLFLVYKAPEPKDFYGLETLFCERL